MDVEVERILSKQLQGRTELITGASRGIGSCSILVFNIEEEHKRIKI